MKATGLREKMRSPIFPNAFGTERLKSTNLVFLNTSTELRPTHIPDKPSNPRPSFIESVTS